MLTQLNTYINVGNENVDNGFLCQNKLFIGHNKLSLTEMDTVTIPEISQGSIIEVGGALFLAENNETISDIDPHTSSTVANGIVYVFINGTEKLAYFTATTGAWDDEKQGWYGSGAYSNYKYVAEMVKATASYSEKMYIPLNNCEKLYSHKGRKPSGYLHNASVTQNQIFDVLSPLIPNVGDILDINGTIYNTPGSPDPDAIIYFYNRVLRFDATRIQLRGISVVLETGVGNLEAAYMEDGDSTTYDYVSLTW